jgi:pimeloyl-ACP methyl ester carboxylesterase
MAYGAALMQSGYSRLRMPVTIIAGADDKVVDVDRHAVRLHEEIPHSVLRLVPGAGHMVHHAVPEQVAEALEAVSGAGDDRR